MPDEDIRKHGLWPVYVAAVVGVVCSLVLGHLVTGRSLVAVLTAYIILAAAGALVCGLRFEFANGATFGRAGGFALAPLLGLTYNMPLGPSLGWVMASALMLPTSYVLGRRIRKSRARI